MDKEKGIQGLNENIYVLKVDMEDRTVEEIAKDAAMQVSALFDKLIEKHNKK